MGAAIGRVVVATFLLASCSHFCHEIGCLTGVVVSFNREFPVDTLPLEVTVCADKVCNTTRLDPISTNGQSSIPVLAQLPLTDRRERDVTVTVEVRSSSSGKVLVDATGTGRLRRSQPNGAGCDPICYSTALTYDDVSNTLTQH
jgi:hypothetical protein